MTEDSQEDESKSQGAEVSQARSVSELKRVRVRGLRRVKVKGLESEVDENKSQCVEES